MNQVAIVFYHDYDNSRHIVKVFTTEERAQQYIKEKNKPGYYYYDLEELEE